MRTSKKLKPLSFSIFQSILTAQIGLIAGILYSFGGLIIDFLVTVGLVSPITYETPGLSIGTVLAFGALIGMPLIFGAIGFILGIIEALLYNLFVNLFGGKEFDIWKKY